MGTSSGLREYLVGHWTVARTVTDHGSCLNGRFTGTAAFTYENDDDAPLGAGVSTLNSPATALEYRSLRHYETGTFMWANQPGMQSERTLLWRPGNALWAMDVFFVDGRPFHSLNFTDDNDPFTSNRADDTRPSVRDNPVHNCAPDTYRGAFAIVDYDAWSYTWRVTGPHKNLLLETVLTRVR